MLEAEGKKDDRKKKVSNTRRRRGRGVVKERKWSKRRKTR